MCKIEKSLRGEIAQLAVTLRKEMAAMEQRLFGQTWKAVGVLVGVMVLLTKYGLFLAS